MSFNFNTIVKGLKKIGGKTVDTMVAVFEAVDSVLGLKYTDGISNTRYGLRMEETWSGAKNSFLENFKTGTFQGTTVRILKSTPLDPNKDGNNLFGTLILGVPPLFTQETDPSNRTMVNTFVKDSLILSLTPGLPKYNGGAYSVLNLINAAKEGGETFTTQNKNGKEMIEYVKRVGLDETFASKDKRYYTFDVKFNEYYSYLEVMLNTLWIKMGLGMENQSTFNIFSFFNISKDGSKMDPTGKNTLLPQYGKSSLGFFVNIAGNITEMVSNETFSANLEDEVNESSDKYQRLNYLTGMGTGKATDNLRRGLGVAVQTGSLVKTQVLDKINFDLSGGALQIAASVAKGINEFTGKTDFSALVQSFMTSNGMKVMYPQLWANSSYTKNITVNFNFVSPYGDPLSIFQYVYVPFFSLLAFALPRQAAENGFVSPLFLRADVPGMITSDLALITDLTWTKGGESGDMWTKDKLPRAISGSFTLTDLYPFLSMVKRLSFLSANPSYTVFLDNMAGISAKQGSNSEDLLSDYWREILTRVAPTRKVTDNVNFNTQRSLGSSLYATATRESMSKNLGVKSVPWLNKR
jgi:hypothetical protein